MLWYSNQSNDTFFIGARFCSECKKYELFQYGYSSNFKSLIIFPLVTKYMFYTRCVNCGNVKDLGKIIKDKDIKQILKKFYTFTRNRDKFLSFYTDIVLYILENYDWKKDNKDKILSELYNKYFDYGLSKEFYEGIINHTIQVLDEDHELIHSKLEELSKLYKEKLITKEEYDNKRKEIISHF